MGLLGYIVELERRIDRILVKTERIKLQMEANMAAAKDFDELVKKLDAATTTLGEKVIRITGELASGGLTAEQESARLAELDAIGDRLVEMGKDQTDPVKPVA